MELPTKTREILRAQAHAADQDFAWPAASWDALREAGVLRWAIPSSFGGDGLALVDLLSGAGRIAEACLTTAFILSQRDAAVRRLLACPAYGLRERFLPRLAAGESFATVGLSQLTTSRQHQAPALQAVPLGGGRDGYRLDGETPWVTGADRADALVIGAVVPGGKQLLAVLPAGVPGITIDPPMPLAGLLGSRTSSVRLAEVIVENQWVLAGPEENVLGKSGGGGLETSSLALGLAGAAIDEIAREAEVRPDLKPLAERFTAAKAGARQKLRHLAASTVVPQDVLDLRVDCTRLALRSTQALLAISKGAGFVSPHPAQRWARQALFFLVWSCPQPAARGILAELTPDCD